jgi:hypothetical protein
MKTTKLPRHVLAKRRRRKLALLWQGELLKEFKPVKLVRVWKYDE